MPIFEYQCRICAHPCELLIRGETQPICPNCGSTELDKQLSLPAAQGKSRAMLQAARSQANREGHFSNYSSAERSKIK